jgi:hypothetical protein
MGSRKGDMLEWHLNFSKVLRLKLIWT